MLEDDARATTSADEAPARKGWASRHPKLAILLIAAVFYIILIGMCAFVFVLVFVRG